MRWLVTMKHLATILGTNFVLWLFSFIYWAHRIQKQDNWLMLLIQFINFPCLQAWISQVIHWRSDPSKDSRKDSVTTNIIIDKYRYKFWPRNKHEILRWRFFILSYYDKLILKKQNKICICIQTSFCNVSANNASSGHEGKCILTNFDAKYGRKNLAIMWMWGREGGTPGRTILNRWCAHAHL